MPDDLLKAASRTAHAGHAPRVLVVDADPTLYGLIEEWLGAEGFDVACGQPAGGAPFDLVIVDIAFPRQAAPDLQRVAAEHPGIPLLALSSTFFSNIPADGVVARALGVTGVLHKPLARDALVAAARRLARDGAIS